MTSAPNAGDALSLVRLAASGAASALALHASRIDDINVYPVPDGDTGANLSQTARSVVEALQANLAPEPSAIARVGARAALLGARGNSGIILSQLVRGLCDRLGEGGPLDGHAIADALRRASTEADAALREPVEGTILTVARALADGAEAARSSDVIATVEAALAAAEAALARTPEHAARRCSRRASSMPAARGSSSSCAVRSPRCAAIPSPTSHRSWPQSTSRSPPTTTGRATARASSSRARSRASCSSGGSRRSATASSSSATASSCARTCTPTTPAARSRPRPTLGALSGVEISDMHAQRDALLAPQRTQPLAPLEDDGRLADILAVVDGDGNRVLYASLGARLLVAGRPTASELVDAMHASPARGHRRCCPTRPQLQVVAEYAAQAAHVPVHVVPTRGLAQGLAALVAYRTDQPAAVLAAALAAAAAWAGSAEVAGRRRRRRRGAARGGRAARSRPARRSSRCSPAPRPSEARSRRSRPGSPQAHPGVELELHAGGQAHPRYSVSAE